MNNNDLNKPGSKELEEQALAKLKMAGSEKNISRETEESLTENEKPSEQTSVEKEQEENAVTKDNENAENKEQNRSEESSISKDNEDKDDDEDLKSLISNAIENKKILDNQIDKSKNKTENTPSKNSERKNSGKTDNKKIGTLKKRWSAKKKTGVALGIIGLIFLLVIGIIIGGFFYYTHLLNRNGDNSKNYNKMPVDESNLTDGDDTFDEKKREEELRAQLSKNASKLSDNSVYNVLLIGEDVRDPDETGRGNTDVMMIISLNTKNKTITLTSLMRDMWVYLEQFNTNSKLNAAYWHGGSEYLEEVIEQYFGIEINRYVSVNFESFIQIVEAVGGLDFDVKENEAEAMKAPLDEVNDIKKMKRGTGYVKAGKQHLNGYQSLAYARIRYNCGDDYGRTERQRAVISQIITKAKQLSFLEINDLLNKVLKEITTDIPDGEIASMLLNCFDYMKYDVQQLQIPASGYFKEDIIYNEAVLSPDYEANAQILQKVIYDDAKTAEEAASEYEDERTNGTAQQSSY